jgi:hypothetical protein
MREWLVARAARLAEAAGAELVVKPTPIFDPTDRDLIPIAKALQDRAQAAAIQLLALHREGATLHVLLPGQQAPTPAQSPAA